jgi:hypothetical protein
MDTVRLKQLDVDLRTESLLLAVFMPLSLTLFNYTSPLLAFLIQ